MAGVQSPQDIRDARRSSQVALPLDVDCREGLPPLAFVGSKLLFEPPRASSEVQVVHSLLSIFDAGARLGTNWANNPRTKAFTSTNKNVDSYECGNAEPHSGRVVALGVLGAPVGWPETLRSLKP